MLALSHIMKFRLILLEYIQGACGTLEGDCGKGLLCDGSHCRKPFSLKQGDAVTVSTDVVYCSRYSSNPLRVS